MKETTTLPVWLVVVLTVVPALVAAGAAVAAAWVAGARKATTQLDQWRRREETMRLLRWAADKTTSTNDADRLLGLSVLDALDRSKPAMLQSQDQGIMDSVLDAALSEPTAIVEEYPLTSGEYEVEVTEGG